MKKVFVVCLAAIFLCACLFSCAEESTGTDSDGTAAVDITQSDISAPVDKIPFPDAQVAKGQLEEIGAYTKITLNGSSAEINGEGASADGSTVTVFSQGQYVVEGTLENGCLIINTEDSDSVKVWLNGVSVTCSDGPAINIIEAPKKVVFNLPAGSVNILSDGAAYADTQSGSPDAALFSKADLKIKGEGTLYVCGNYSKGIVTKDDFEMTGGILYVSSVADGIKGKDSILISNGTLFVNAGGDGIQSDNDEDADKGNIMISGGYVEIESALDSVQAEHDLTVSGGTLLLKSGGGSENASTNEGWGNWGGSPPNGGGQGGTRPESPPNGGGQGGTRPEAPPNGGQGGPRPGGGDHGGGAAGGGTFDPNQSTQQTDTESAKGLKAGISVYISGGSISIDSSDDAVHSNGTVSVSGGSISIASGDDGIHGDDRLDISGGSVSVAKSYEGLEATEINIRGGEIRIVASDDGLNAAGGNDGSSVGGRPGQNNFGSSNGKIVIDGGYCVVDASGDGIDSNGSVVMSDGFLAVYGPTGGGNGVLDYASSFELNGGTLLAVGTSDMMQTVNSQTQAVISQRISVPAQTTVSIKDSTGNHVITFCTQKQIGCLIFSSPSLTAGECSIYTGGTYSAEAKDGIFSGGTYTEGTLKTTVTAS